MSTMCFVDKINSPNFNAPRRVWFNECWQEAIHGGEHVAIESKNVTHVDMEEIVKDKTTKNTQESQKKTSKTF